MIQTEPMRVRQDGNLWLVELKSAAIGRWIVQGEHLTREAAEADLKSWEPPRCNHWPGQQRCEVCGMGFDWRHG